MITNISEKIFLTTNEVPVFGGNRLQTATQQDKVTTLKSLSKHSNKFKMSIFTIVIFS